MEQYQTTGEDTIWRVIARYYSVDVNADPGKAKEIYDQVARANPHIVHLETLTVGDVLNLPSLVDETPTQRLRAINKRTKSDTDQETE